MDNLYTEVIAYNLILFIANQSDGAFLQSDDIPCYTPSIRLEEMDTAELLAIIGKASELVRGRIGSSSLPLGENSDKGRLPERIRITQDCRILLPERGDAEIRMAALPKSLFILFLKHPEGIDVRRIGAYSTELFQIYCRITNRLDADGIKNSIERLSDKRNNCFNAHKTQLSRTLSRYFSDSVLGNYLISGPGDGARYIPLGRSFVSWE